VPSSCRSEEEVGVLFCSAAEPAAEYDNR